MNYKIVNGESTFDAVILASGDFPKAFITVDILCKTKPLIACDNAFENILAFNKTHDESSRLHPSAIVGDGDSLSSELKEVYKPIWHQYSEQEFNDLTKATKFAIRHYSPKSIAYMGATGKREDHTIGNISLMRYYFEHLNIMPYLITDYGWFTVATGENTFESFPRQQISIFNCNCKNLSSENLKYKAYPFTELWQGTLNDAVGNQFTINGDGTYIIFSTFLPKIISK